MKKQLIVITLFLLAIIGSKETFAQPGTLTVPVSCLAPNAIECLTDNALSVIPGKPYMYTVTVPNIAATSGEFTWFVTQNPDFISTGTLNTGSAENPAGTGTILAGVGAGGGSYLNTPAGTGTASIELIWKSFDPTLDVFVVINVKGTNSADCPVNNLKVYKILPLNAFTLDIANIDPATPAALPWGTTFSSCVPGVVEAHYDDATTTVQYDYGQNYIYYLVNAANFSGSYDIDFQVTGVAAGEVVTADWAYNSGTNLTWTAMALAGTPLTASATINAQAANGTAGAAGECIVVRLLVDHTTSIAVFNEGIVAQPISMAIDGTTGGTLNLPDLHYTGGAGVCGVADAFANDIATHTLNPRPNIVPSTPTPFVTGTGRP